MLRPGDTIEYLVDVSSPPNQKGIRGQTKIIDREIPLWTAKFLLHGGKVRPFDPASPLQLETEEIEKSPDGPADVPGPDTEAGTKARPTNGEQAKPAAADKKERRTKTNGQRKSNSERNQTGDHGPKKPDPKRRGGCSGD